MFDALYRYIAAEVTISSGDFERIRERFTYLQLPKKQYLLREGEVCRQVAFVVRGILRQYLVDAGGAEHITQFAPENWWISDRESLMRETPSAYFIQALEDCDLLLIRRQALLELESTVPAFRKLMEIIKDRNAFAGKRRVVSALSYSADEKYAGFLANYPEIARRVPQHMIASYLGLTPETLSRLRRRRSGGNG